MTFKAAVEYLNSDVKGSQSTSNVVEPRVYIPRSNGKPVTPPNAENISSPTPSVRAVSNIDLNQSKKSSSTQENDPMLSPRTKQMVARAPPEVIRLDKSDELGEFLSKLKEDTTARTSWQGSFL